MYSQLSSSSEQVWESRGKRLKSMLHAAVTVTLSNKRINNDTVTVLHALINVTTNLISTARWRLEKTSTVNTRITVRVCHNLLSVCLNQNTKIYFVLFWNSDHVVSKFQAYQGLDRCCKEWHALGFFLQQYILGIFFCSDRMSSPQVWAKVNYY